MSKYRLSEYQMRAMPFEQISNRSQRYPKIPANTLKGQTKLKFSAYPRVQWSNHNCHLLELFDANANGATI